MTDWETARCIGKTSLFYDEGRESSVKKCKKICEKCPLRAPCLEWALSHGEAYGIWSGLTYQELRLVAIAKGYPPPDRSGVEHGTERVWADHKRRGEPPCELCRIGYNNIVKERMKKYRKRKIRGR